MSDVHVEGFSPDSAKASSVSTQCAFPFELPVGNFAYSELKKASLVELAEKLFFGVKLESSEQYRLVSSVSLPLLGLLIRMKRHASDWPQLTAVRPLICLPIGGMLERKNKAEVLKDSEAQLSKILEKVNVFSELYLIVDYWRGGFDRSDLVAILRELTRAFDPKVKIVPLGPSTVDIQAMVRSDEPDDYRSVIFRILSELKEMGVSSIDGGTDLPIHREAASAGLQVAVGQQIQPLSCSAGRDWAERFCDDIEFVRTEIMSSDRCVVWYPWTDHSIKETEAGAAGPLGIQMLRVIALGRLLLPSIKHIRAPWSLLGNSIAHLALTFGANDLGFGAIDYRTAEQLRITRISETTHLAGSPVGFMRSSSGQ
jgi:hypothetical protein